jgi:hypothetical protein
MLHLLTRLKVPSSSNGTFVSATGVLLCAKTFPALSVRRSSGGQHEYVRQLSTRDGDSDKNANRWENGQTETGRGADRLCGGFKVRCWLSSMTR